MSDQFQHGLRAASPSATALLLVRFSFGVLAQPVMGAAAAITMSMVVFGGSAQFACPRSIVGR